MKCPICEVAGELFDDIIDGRIEITYPCGFCDGTGRIGFSKWVGWKLSLAKEQKEIGSIYDDEQGQAYFDRFIAGDR